MTKFGEIMGKHRRLAALYDIEWRLLGVLHNSSAIKPTNMRFILNVLI